METMELDARILAKAKSMKISSIEVTDFERNIRDFTNVYILKSVWLGDPTKLILRSYYQLWGYQCLLEKHIKNTPDIKEVLPPLPVVEDTDHMNVIEQYLMSLVLMVRNGSSMSAFIKNLFLPWKSDELIKEEYLASSSRSPTKSDREVVGLKSWFKVVGNFSSDDVQLMNVYEGDLVQNLGSVLQGIQELTSSLVEPGMKSIWSRLSDVRQTQHTNDITNNQQIPFIGWCFCKREQELGKLPEAILTPCTLTLQQIEAERVRLQEIRELKSLPTFSSTPSSPNKCFEPECDYVEMNPFLISQVVTPSIPPPFKPNSDGVTKLPPAPPVPPARCFQKSSLPISLEKPWPSTTAKLEIRTKSESVEDELILSSTDRYVIPDLEKTLTEEKQAPPTKPPPPRNKLVLHKTRSKSVHFSNKKSPTEPTETKESTLVKTETRASKIDYYAKSTLGTWEEVKRVTQQTEQNSQVTCIIHKDAVRPGCALCARSQWMAAGSGAESEVIYRCVESHSPSQPTQLSVNQGDLVNVVKKNTNGWWDVSSLKSSVVKSLPATKLSREPQTLVPSQKNFAMTRRNTSLETLEHEYYDLTDGVKQSITADVSTSSIPITLDPKPMPYLTPIVNAQPPPHMPPKSNYSDKLLLSENEISRGKTAGPKKLQVKFQPTQTQDKCKAKTLTPKPNTPDFEASQKQNSPLETKSKFFLSESTHYQPPRLNKDSDSGSEKQPGLLNKLATLSNTDSKKRTSTFVSYLSDDNKENLAAAKPKMERVGSGGYKSLSREEKSAWSSLGKQDGFFGSLAKERADELLKQSAVNGEYLIRASSTKEDSFVLCVFHGSGVHRYLINFTDGKFVTGEPPMSFSDFSDVVSYYKVNALEVTNNNESLFLKQPLLMKRQTK